MSKTVFTSFEKTLASHAARISGELDRRISLLPQKGEITRPRQLVDAMRHAVLNGGKRLRPFLLIESAGLFGVTAKASLPAATALECMHCYSLVHDDLPAMDDDDLRRGKPTVHKKWDEATAILAGDGLLTLAFDILADKKAHKDPDIRLELILHLAQASGIGGMAGGQMLDLQAEKKTPDENGIKTLQAMKTGALIRYACEAGAILGAASKRERNALVRYGNLAGQAFQLADDILDVTSTTMEMGKKVAKDGARKKGTLVGLYGLQKARQLADELVDEAIQSLRPFGKRAARLADCANYMIARKN